MGKRMHFVAAALFIGAASLPAFAENGPGVTAAEIKIGNTMPYSGPASGYATQGRAEQAFYAMINAKGGINGRKVNFLSYDDAYSPPKTVEQTRKLVEQDNIFADFGSLGTPTNSAIQKYMNQQKVPHLFISTGADKWNDTKNFPYTISLYPSYTMEARVAAKYIKSVKPDGKIAILFQNDDFGRDYVKGFKQGLGDAAAKMIIKELPYEVSDPTIDSQMLAFKNSGADTFFDVTTPKFGAQAIKKAAEIGWKPLHYIASVASSIKTVLEPAGYENSTGIVTGLAYKIPSDPQWKDDPDVTAYYAFIKDWSPGSDPNDASAAVGYGSAWLTAQVLEKCGNDLTRDNLMKIVTHLKDVSLPLALPGVTVSFSPDDYSPFSKLQVSRFDGKTWQPLGAVISGDIATQ